MTKQFAEKTALVTGGGTGIGRAAARLSQPKAALWRLSEQDSLGR